MLFFFARGSLMTRVRDDSATHSSLAVLFSFNELIINYFSFFVHLLQIVY
ncbi:hypothetical protein YC2023_018913 [Brassica napus]